MGKINTTRGLMVALTMGLSLLAGCASTQTEKLASKEQYSGYLSNYDDLKKVETKNGLEYLRWISPKVKPGQYTRVLHNPVSFYPNLTPSQKASRKTLMDIGKYYDEAIESELSVDGVLATAPGPGVAEAQLAITGVYISTEGMKAYEVVPVAALVALGSTALGERDQIVQLVVEGKLTDSQTGEVLATAVYKGLGKDLPNEKAKLTVDDVKPVLNEWAKNMATQIKQLLVGNR